MSNVNGLLARYINGGCLSRRDTVISLVAPTVPCRLNARRVARLIRDDQDDIVARSSTAEALTLAVPPYEGSNNCALRMRQYIARHLAEDVTAAIVHGSIGTGEELAYSDFDGLVILRAAVFENRKRLSSVATRLDRARTIMFDFDPLQHHGWFALAEHQLRAYPDSYLPVEVLRHARALFPTAGVRLELAPVRDRAAGLSALDAISRSIWCRVASDTPARNMFELKSLLSQVMLLPALHVQVRDGRGVFKKDSFRLARPDFDPAVWAVMDEVSEIRAHWEMEVTSLRRRLLQARSPAARRFARRCAPPVPPKLARRLDRDFYDRIQRLARAFRTSLVVP